MESMTLYEVHVTVSADDTSRWQDFCRRMGMKPLLIELAEGVHARQLMCAATYTGGEAGARAFAADLEYDVAANGFHVVRTKLECPLVIRGETSPTVYYECHIKLDLEREQESEIDGLCRDFGFSASREMFSKTDRTQKWYLTERHYEGKTEDVREKFRAALVKVRGRLPVRAMDSERVILDSNPHLDEGWV